MSQPEPIDPELAESTQASLGRAWVGPALILAGLVSLLRAKVLVGLGAEPGSDTVFLARWVALAQWPALMVQALLMSAAAVAVVWSSQGVRLLVALAFATLIVASVVTGWPVEEAQATLSGHLEGLPSPAAIALGAFMAALVVAGLATLCRRTPALEQVMESLPCLALVALPALGLPAYKLWQDSVHVPQMRVREDLGQLHAVGSWSVVSESPRFPAWRGLLRPFAGLGPNVDAGPNLNPVATREEHDTLEKTSLIMPPSCEVTLLIPPGLDDATLSLSAQIAGRHTERAGALGEQRKSDLDLADLESVSVRFEVLLDGMSVWETTVTHRHADEAKDREWRSLHLEVSSGQVITLRTEFGDEDSARAFAERELQCGFGDLMLCKWKERSRTHASPESPNILFITVDSLRADRLGCYGYEKPTTPHLDALAREGVLFEKAFSTSSWTSPSSASLFTGLLPYEHGVLSENGNHLGYAHQTLAEALQNQGFTTAAITANPLIDRRHQFDQGFEFFDSAQHLRPGEEVIERIESRLRDLAKARFFLYVHLADPRTPQQALPAELKRLGGKLPDDFPGPDAGGSNIDGMDAYAEQIKRGDVCDEFGVIHPNVVVPEAHAQWISDRYDGSVATADHYVGRILTALGQLGLEQTTVIALTSDHGEELLDHNMYGHGHSLYQELVHVPLILAGPAVPQGLRLSHEVSNRHLVPTLAKIGGTSLSSISDPIDLLDPKRPEQDIFYQTSEGYWNGHHGVQVQGLRADGHVLHFAPEGSAWKAEPTAESRVRMFHTESDFYEDTNLALEPKFAAIAESMLKTLTESVQAQKARQRTVVLDALVPGLQVQENSSDQDETRAAPQDKEH